MENLRRIAVVFGVALVLGVSVVSAAEAVAGTSSSSDVARNLEWAEKAFSDRAGSVTQNNVVVVHEEFPGETKNGLANAGGPIRLGDKVYKHGFGVNSPSTLRVTLTKPVAAFKSVIGLDRNVDEKPASVRFHLIASGKDLFASDIMRPGATPRSIDVPLRGAESFDLVVDDGGDGRSFDQANWADARVVLQDGSEVWLDDLARHAQVSTDIPFSFVYGGRPSSELLVNWKKSVNDEVVGRETRRRTLILMDPATGLEVRAVARIYTNTGGVDWTLYFTNKGDKDTPILEKINAVDLTVNTGVGVSPVLHRIHGSSGGALNWQPYDDTLSVGQELVSGTPTGRPAEKTGPFFNLQWNDGGVITAIGWSGAWQASVSRPTPYTARVCAGMQFARLKLHPGETIRTPRIMQYHWSGADEASSYNGFRRVMFDHIMPRIDGKLVVPPLTAVAPEIGEFPLWRCDEYSEVAANRDIARIKGLGFEYYWIDAFYRSGRFPWNIGNDHLPISTIPDTKRFSQGIEPVSEAVHKAGMKLLMWFEPERVTDGTWLHENHHEWLISPTANFPPALRYHFENGFHLLDLGNAEACDYMTELLSTAIKQWNVQCLRVDYNICPLPFWQEVNQADPDRVGISEIRYVEGLYQMWDNILQDNPHLFIDNCASGGTRIDLETCSRSIPLWRTDDTIWPFAAGDYNANSLLNHTMTAGLSRYVPFSISGQIGSDPYNFRSGYNAGLCLVDRPVEADRDELKAALSEGKRLRKYYFGDFYALTNVNLDPTNWCVTQLHRPKDQDGMVMLFRRHKSAFSAFSLSGLRDIDPKANYQITQSHTYKRSAPVTMKGSKLLRLSAEIRECPGSLVIEYKRISK